MSTVRIHEPPVLYFCSDGEHCRIRACEDNHIIKDFAVLYWQIVCSGGLLSVQYSVCEIEVTV